MELSFEEAEGQLTQELEKRGMPKKIVWVTKGDLCLNGKMLFVRGMTGIDRRQTIREKFKGKSHKSWASSW